MADTSVYLAEGSATDGVAEIVKDVIKGSRVRYSIDPSADEEPGYTVAIDLSIKDYESGDIAVMYDKADKIRDTLVSKLGLNARTENELEEDADGM
ncbi:hypothetical protein [Rhodococcus erythropolis]|uniref:hypothetical protein n=1 Tax=Rhodococcus erythropolis TaxID=1833 RepID=UPI001BE93662|nr:hypothetical protein [Rhodococcus erythropolis]MBT2265914.1 hypothetical protein [Rhodococcus erythropolis]